MGPRLEAQDAALVIAIAEAAAPAGKYVRAPSHDTVRGVERIVGIAGADGLSAYASLLRAFDLASMPTHGARLSALPLEARKAAIDELALHHASNTLVRLATGPIKLAAVTHPDFPAALGSRLGLDLVPPREEPNRWGERLMDAGTLDDGETLEVDVVIVGSGAGGGPVAHALASRGHAVLVLEAGAHLTRKDFVGRPSDRAMAFQRTHVTLGNTAIVLPTGATVGGTTTVNSGTCFRTPPEVMRRWRFEHGLVDLHPDAMAPFFERVEAMMGVAPNEHRYLGKVADVIARGAEALGLEHGPLPRNAPDCDGQGLCCFGCPTDAKRSVNVSYVPAALDRGAMLFHHARVEEILMAGGRAVGVVARATHGRGGRIRVLAKTVVLSAGTLGTPAMLLGLGLANSSGQVGRNLTVHPCSNSWGRFDEPIRGWEGVPQGYGVDSYADEGIRFEGASLPIDVAAATLPMNGRAWTDFVDDYERMACYGFMTQETSRGRVVLGPRNRPQMLYVMNDFDRRRIIRAQGILARIFLAAGAKEVLVSIHGVPPLRSDADVTAMLDQADSIGAHRFDLSAYHPLGTCQMGVDPSRSVVGPTNETHDVPGLFVVDGSSVSGPLGVNPQVTIMALAERASGFVERRIENPMATTIHHTSAPLRETRGANPPKAEPALEFTETMSGDCTMLDGGRRVDAAFTVRCSTNDAKAMTRGLFDAGGGVLELDGETTIGGLATKRRCHGTLEMHPLRRRGTLIYDLDFTGDDGAAYHLHGEKSVPLTSVVRGMTVLATEIARSKDGAPVARGTLEFDLRGFVPWLATFRFRRGRR